jgi:metallo-beta-lactamase family protein
LALKLSFLGGAGTVTGSKFLVENGGARILVDCGLFQGFKALRLKNWATFPVRPASINAVVLTHAHIDHSGYLPLLVKQGFSGPVFCTQSTLDLCCILLPDAGHLQEKDAEFANRRGFSKHKPALPLFTEADARKALSLLRPLPFGEDHVIPGGKIYLRRAGHILGAASVELQCANRIIVFSGDIGRYDDPIMFDPECVERADYLLVESTYGDRTHSAHDPANVLAQIVGATVARGGTILIPAFAVGRAQTILLHLQRLTAAGRLPGVPIFLDSPMAADASDIFCANTGDHKLSESECRSACGVARYTRSVEASKAIDQEAGPKVIISASGMATGGRVLYHLKHFASDPRNTILFAGFQAGGTRGAAMIGGAQSVKIHGEYVPIRAEVKNLDMLSAHADAGELMRWLRGFRGPPRSTFIVHGEATASDALRHRIEEDLHWSVLVPDHGQSLELA